MRILCRREVGKLLQHVTCFLSTDPSSIVVTCGSLGCCGSRLVIATLETGIARFILCPSRNLASVVAIALFLQHTTCTEVLGSISRVMEAIRTISHAEAKQAQSLLSRAGRRQQSNGHPREPNMVSLRNIA